MKSSLSIVAITVTAALLLGACSDKTPPAPEAAPAAVPAEAVVDAVTATSFESDARPAMAKAGMHGAEGHEVQGVLRLSSTVEGVHIEGRLTGLAPGGTHGFHVHENGDCSAADFSSAGPHFNPDDHAHGHPGADGSHAGDMPNVVADADGAIAVDLVAPGLTLRDGGSHDIAGRALVLHAQADDYASQPAGDSGARIACGVIE